MKKITTIIFVFLILGIVIQQACTPKLEGPKPDAGNADLSKVIAIGGNYMAGYQDGALYLKGQKLSLPALIEEQLKLAQSDLIFNQPLMPDNNGIGLNSKTWENRFTATAHLGYKTDCSGVTSLMPLINTIPAGNATAYLTGVAGNSVQNLAVPFANLSDYFSPGFGNSFASGNPNPYYNRFASYPGISTLFQDIKAQHATFIMSWLGMEDIYNYASSGGTSAPIPSSASFSASLDSIFGVLTANGAKGVIATIPDFRSFPYYTLVAWNNAVISQGQADTLNNLFDPSIYTHIHFSQGANGFVIIDPNLPEGYRQLHQGEYITLSVPIDSMKCQKYGLMVEAINNRYALDSAEVAIIDQAISSYNSIIVQKAAQYNLALADMHSFFNSVKSGIKWNGADFNAEFVTGGFFSLDGYHPNQKGYALIANEFIKAINLKYNAVIPTVTCSECDGVLFP